MPIYSTQIVRLDGLMLAASVEDQQSDREVGEIKGQQRQIIRRMTNTSEPRAAIETGNFKLQYAIRLPLLASH